MATTTTETLSVNGVVLNTLAKNIESLAGRLRTPAKRTQNITVPGRHGSVRVPNKKFDENTIVLPMWVVGSDDDGKIPFGSSARKEFFKRIDELTALFLGSADLLDVRHTLPDGSIRQCFGDVLEVIDFSAMPNALAKFSVALTVPAAFWQDLDPIEVSRSGNGASAVFDDFTTGTAPMEDLDVTILGPWTNPKLTFPDGSWVQYNATLTSAQSLTIHSGTWSLTGVGFTPQLSKLAYNGSSSHWVSLPPGPNGSTIQFGGSGQTSATTVTLDGRRKYLVG